MVYELVLQQRLQTAEGTTMPAGQKHAVSGLHVGLAQRNRCTFHGI